MIGYVIVGVVSGILFGVMDGVINANPFARKLFEVYGPIAKTSVNAPAGIVIDLAYGFIMGFIFLLLYRALPTDSGLVKGIVFALVVWFFRVLMNVASTWMMYEVPVTTLAYTALAGLGEMLVVGIVYGLFLRPFWR
jgi:hypothetical protein